MRCGPKMRDALVILTSVRRTLALLRNKFSVRITLVPCVNLARPGRLHDRGEGLESDT
jgi:hypothetical protein